MVKFLVKRVGSKKKIGRLEWMTEAELIVQLNNLPMDSDLRVLKIVVTDDDCARSNQGHPLSCAIATAGRRMLPKASYVGVKHHGLTVTISGYYLHFAGSNKISQSIRAFDEYGVKPPPLVYRLFNIQKIRKLSEARKEQVNEARRKRAAEGRPDKIYNGDPLRLRTTKMAKKAA